MAKKPVLTAKEAAAMIPDGATIMCGGFLACGQARAIVKELVARGTKDLTLIANDMGRATGPKGEEFFGIAELIHNHQVKRVIATHVGMTPEVGQQNTEGTLEVNLLPQGTLAECIRAGGAGLGGVLTPVGIDTLVEDSPFCLGRQTIDGKDYLLMKPIHADFALLGTYKCDEYGNCSGMGGKTNCGVLSYAYVDAEMADYVVAVTDCLVDYPNYPAEINQTKVDYVCVVDQIGIPEKIATGAAKPTTDQRKILMAEYCTQVVANTPYFKDGFSYQTGVGGASIASTISLSKIMEEKNIHMGLGVGGLTKPMCELLDRGLARKLVDTQDFDLDAVNNVRTNPNHFPISAGEYASPMNKGAFVNKLDYVILASLEVDTHFNCNVVVGSDGIITGAQGGHPDTAQGAKCTIVIAPLLQGRIPAICTDVTTVTTPGESVDIVVTDYGVAVNPRRPDLLEALKAADCVPLKTIEELRDIAYSIVGEPEKVQFGDRIVGIIEARDGTVMDVVREVKPFSFRED